MSDPERSAYAGRPLFIDNRDGNTLARAITTHLGSLRGAGRIPAELCVANCYFDPAGARADRMQGETTGALPPGRRGSASTCSFARTCSPITWMAIEQETEGAG